MLGDGYTIPYHCPNAYEELWWYSEPDSGPWLCSIDDDYDDQNNFWNVIKRPFRKV